jgi:hypothetical protein
MFSAFLAQAARSPGRQRALRLTAAAHVLALALACGVILGSAPGARGAVMFGQFLLVAGIVEGALLIGWRLAQLPKSRSLEFLLASPLRPRHILLAEAGVGLLRLALVTLSGLPVLLILAANGFLDPSDLPALLLMPCTWGAVTGLGLTTWAYESPGVRRWGERVVLGLIALYLLVGVLAGEHLRDWLALLPGGWGDWAFQGFAALHRYNPFGVLRGRQEEGAAAGIEAMVGLEVGALAAVWLLLSRASGRFFPHFQDLHYSPVEDRGRRRRERIGRRPLSWWAVRRVLKYSGRVNLWLAGGFGVLYALYTVSGPRWPAGLGRRVFEVVNEHGGVPLLATALVVLAAVPAAFQYGLWDSNTQDRCRRLELLLLTRLRARDYWHAAAAAAWRRGQGYFAVALLLWCAALIAGRLHTGQVLAGLAAGVILWGLYFALGFRAFARGYQANGLGILLTLGLPLFAFGLYQVGWADLAGLIPPASVYSSGKGPLEVTWGLGPALAAVGAMTLTRSGLARCLGDLHNWYDKHHGRKVMD